MNTKLRTDTKTDFEKDFFKLMNNSVFKETMENGRKYRNTRLVTTNKRESYLPLEQNDHTTKWFLRKILPTEVNNAKAEMNKPIYLGLSILEISKTAAYEFWYDYVKVKYQDKANLCYMDTDSLIVNRKTANVHKDIVNDVGKDLTHQTMKLKDRYQ